MIADIILKIAEDEKIAEDKQKEEEEKEYYARPSLAGPGRCMRQMVYWGRKFEKKPLPGRAVMIFSDSSFHEDLTADWIRRSAYKLHSEQMEVKINNLTGYLTGHLTGHIDGILTDLQGKDILWEHKALNHFTFSMFEKGENLPLDYITQCALYSKGLQLIQPEMTDILLLIKNKNTAQYMEYLMSYDTETDCIYIHNLISSTEGEKTINKEIPNVTEKAFVKFAVVKKHIKEKTLPARQYERSDWQCSYCPYGKECWEGWEAEIEQMETDAELNEEIETMANYYLELSMHEKEAKKEKNEIKKNIKALMKEKNVREGKAGKYILSLAIRHRKESLQKAYSFEVLTIRLKKEA